MTAGPASSIALAEPSSRPVPIDPPTATMADLPGAELVTKSLLFVRRCAAPASGTYTRKATYVPKFKSGMTFVTRARPLLHCCPLPLLLESPCRLLPHYPSMADRAEIAKRVAQSGEAPAKG